MVHTEGSDIKCCLNTKEANIIKSLFGEREEILILLLFRYMVDGSFCIFVYLALFQQRKILFKFIRYTAYLSVCHKQIMLFSYNSVMG